MDTVLPVSSNGSLLRPPFRWISGNQKENAYVPLSRHATKSIGRNDLTYGLLAEELIGIKWTAVAVIPDISCDCALVTHLAERCTHGQLAPFQMLDVVLDVLLL